MIQMRSKRIIDEYHGYSFSRPSMAYGSTGKLYYPHNARFSEGKFGQAVLVEEGTTNLITKDFDRWTNNLNLELTKNDDWDYTLKRTNDSNSYLSVDMPCTPNTTYCFSIEQLINSDMEQIFIFQRGVQSATESNRTNIKSPGKYSLIFTTAENDTRLRIYIHCGSSGEAGQQARIRLPQLEKLTYPTTFVNGTRAGDNLSISPDVINLAEGEIELTVIPHIPQIISSINIHFEANAGSTNKNQFLIWKENIYWRVGLIDKDGTVRRIDINYDGQVGVPTDIKLKWRNINSGSADAEVKAIINGVEKGRITGVQIDMDPLTVAYIGRRANSEVYYGDALYDDLRISNIYRADEDDIAAYESNQPLPVDQYTTLKLGFDGPDGQRGTTIVTL